jgi:hypothetical protein
MYVIPKPGLMVPDPVLRDVLPPEGRLVARSEHWIRRLRDGDVTEGEPPPDEPHAEQPASPPDDGGAPEPEADTAEESA